MTGSQGSSELGELEAHAAFSASSSTSEHARIFQSLGRACRIERSATTNMHHACLVWEQNSIARCPAACRSQYCYDLTVSYQSQSRSQILWLLVSPLLHSFPCPPWPGQALSSFSLFVSRSIASLLLFAAAPARLPPLPALPAELTQSSNQT